eukprot:COSAG06_NODE_30953_length_529_cov_1.151163_2_plen_56_part_01
MLTGWSASKSYVCMGNENALFVWDFPFTPVPSLSWQLKKKKKKKKKEKEKEKEKKK